MSSTVPLSLSTAERLEAIEEIKRVKSTYAYAADLQKWDEFVAVFAPDASFDESHFPAAYKPGTNEPVPEAVFEYLRNFSTGIEWPLFGRQAIYDQHVRLPAEHRGIHHLTNPIIELTSDTTANAIHRYESFQYLASGAPVQFLHILGIYHETYVRLEDGHWYIQSMRLERLRIECA